MAIQTCGAESTPIYPETAPELCIDFSLDRCVIYSGTAAQLHAEGLIPDGFEWPRADAFRVWEARGFHHFLSRRRPTHHKGPKHSWLELDHWAVNVTVSGCDGQWHVWRERERQAVALAAAYRLQTAAGRAASHIARVFYRAACDDLGFQNFKARVPALVPPKRVRKPKAEPPGQGIDHA